MNKAKINWIDEQCQDIEDSMKKNNSKKTYQLVKDLTSTKQGRAATIQDKDGKCLTEEQDILKRWTEYCSELYNYRATGDPEVLNVPPATDNDNYPILREEVEAAVKSLKKGKSAGADNVPAELVQAGGEAMISALLTICNKIRQTGEWPTPWTQSLIITLRKKGNLQLCQNYRTISLISHPSKVMLKVLWADWSRNRKRSSLWNKQACRSSTLGYCARSTSNTSKASITSSLTSRRRSTGYGMQHYGHHEAFQHQRQPDQNDTEPLWEGHQCSLP